MNMELRKLSPDDGADIYDMLQEIPKDENGFLNGCNGKSYEDYKAWLVANHNAANGVGLEDRMVPQTIYWLFVDGKPVGMGKLRHALTDKLREEGGHAGYAVVASERNHGFGKALLKLLVGEAKGMGIEKLLLTVQNRNLPSIKVETGCGGVIEKISDIRHYIWIDCSAAE